MHKRARLNHDLNTLMYLIRQDVPKNVYGTACPELFKVCRNGTRNDIE